MPSIFGRFTPISIAAAVALLGGSVGLHAQNFPVTAGQKATAAQVAELGIPLAELAPNAPDSYSVKRGDTLWAISGLFLKSPWRWPELWGMNLQDISNPHRIYPGQQLYLDKSNGRAILRTRQASQDGPPTDTIRLSPRTRSQSLTDASIPTLSSQIIEPFLAEALIVDEATFSRAPRIVAAQEGRVLLSRGDRAYARGEYVGGKATGKPLSDAKGEPLDFRVFRNATPLKDPSTQKILGYEAQYVGKAELVRGESMVQVEGQAATDIVPATIDIVATKEEMWVGDRLLPEPPRELRSYVPHAPASPINGQIVSVYGSAVAFAAENQVVVINRGTQDGLERGHVMAIVKDGQRLQDKTDSARPQLKLPNERNGLMMVFRTFENLSYALVLQVTDGVKVGDRFVNPN
ncbi:LysM domain-containing protein [Polaromonas sp. OV174]|uniref:LysM peptidoglycan-binding domain-containing protein n=1 Tax=Polaromonas sp. OV174 TaxID=1855300 RepID=UPI0008F218FA|nr:LysM domain-containing protein [Polaromonas sp. OV174]SFC30245.1 LysM domain-containing protein [Polaromonas sp. OV174]